MDTKALLAGVFFLAVVGIALGIAWVIIKDRKDKGGDGAGVRLLDKLMKKEKK